jgi:hypothetical protein
MLVFVAFTSEKIISVSILTPTFELDAILLYNLLHTNGNVNPFIAKTFKKKVFTILFVYYHGNSQNDFQIPTVET